MTKKYISNCLSYNLKKLIWFRNKYSELFLRSSLDINLIYVTAIKNNLLYKNIS